MKICWLFIEKSLRYLCWTHIIRLGEPCKEKKKGKIQFDFSFFSFFRCVWTKQRFQLFCCWRGLISVAFSFSCSFVFVRQLIYSWLNFSSGQVHQHTQHNRLLYNIEKKWTLSGWFLEKRSFLSEQETSFILDRVYIDFWSLWWKGNNHH